MPKQFYCSICGAELIHTRKAVPGKRMILDLITPHECEGYAIKGNEDSSPTVLDLIESAATKFRQEQADRRTDRPAPSPINEPGDRRKEALVTSTAPQSLIRNIHDLGE